MPSASWTREWGEGGLGLRRLAVGEAAHRPGRGCPIRHSERTMSEDVNERWRTMWAEVDRRHVEAKDSQGATAELYGRYAELNDAERKQVNKVPFKALEKGSESERYDALAIINRFNVVEGLEPLRRLAIRLQLDDSPGAPFELVKVRRCVGRLKDSTGDYEP